MFVLIFVSCVHESLFVYGLDNPPYINSFNCFDKYLEIDNLYKCFVGSQGNPAPGLFFGFFLFKSLQLDYAATMRLLALLYAFSLAYALWRYKFPLFSLTLIAGTCGFYATYILWSAQQQLLIFFFCYGSVV